ncbi:MAG: kelch repeat-containing protein [Niabella sp.]
MQLTTKKSLALLLLAATLVSVFSCSKSSNSSSSDLVGNWAVSSEFSGVGRTDAVSFTIGDKVYIGLGNDGTNMLNDFWVFDEKSNKYTQIANFPGEARSKAVAFSVNGKGYVGTGSNGRNKLDDFWEYDPATDTWVSIAPFPGGVRHDAVAFTIGSTGYVATGYDGVGINSGNYRNDLWAYTPASGWQQKADLPNKKSEAVAFVYDNKAYVVTGQNNGSLSVDLAVYDPSTNAWTKKRNINSSNSEETYDDDYGSNITRKNAVAFVLGNKAFISTGNNGSVLKTTWVYDIASDLWSQKTAFEASSGREGAVAFVVNNKAFVGLGNNSSARFDDVWRFDPDAAQSNDDNY